MLIRISLKQDALNIDDTNISEIVTLFNLKGEFLVT